MGADAHLDWHAGAASALGWWHDAGVDTLVDDAPRDWFATVSAPLAVAAAPVRSATMPSEWTAFSSWRTGPDAPETGWHGTAIPASGPVDARIMILVDCPDRDDLDDGSLLGGGAAARLFVRMLAAIGLDRDSVHLAALCTKRPVAGRLPPDAEETLHRIARHHIALVAPRRLLVMGNAASRALLGMDVMAARGRLHRFNHKEGMSEVVATFHPRFLLEQPVRKAEAWRDLKMVAGFEVAGFEVAGV